MVKIITNLFVLLTIIQIILIKDVRAENKVAGHSALISYGTEDKASSAYKLNIQKLAAKKILTKYNSVFLNKIDTTFETCSKYNIDCYMLLSISGVESYFGKFTYPGSYNAFGWGGGLIMFESWEDGFNKVAQGISENYMKKGYDTVEKMAPIYCPPSNTWSGKVNHFYNEFKQEEEKISKNKEALL